MRRGDVQGGGASEGEGEGGGGEGWSLFRHEGGKSDFICQPTKVSVPTEKLNNKRAGV